MHWLPLPAFIVLSTALAAQQTLASPPRRQELSSQIALPVALHRARFRTTTAAPPK